MRSKVIGAMDESVVENVTSNVTGRDAATAEGIAITYSSLFLMALLPLLFGSLRSVGYHGQLKVETTWERCSNLVLLFPETWRGSW